MDWLIWILFESFPALAGILGVALFVLLVYWRRSGQVRPLLIGLAAAVVLLIVQSLVVTKREHADRILTAVVADLVKTRTDALAAALAPECETAGMNRDEFIAYVAHELRDVQVRWADCTRLRVEESAADRFVVRADYISQIVSHEFAATPRSSWSITFVRTSDGWKIAHLHCAQIDDVTAPGWPARPRQ